MGTTITVKGQVVLVLYTTQFPPFFTQVPLFITHSCVIKIQFLFKMDISAVDSKFPINGKSQIKIKNVKFSKDISLAEMQALQICAVLLNSCYINITLSDTQCCHLPTVSQYKSCPCFLLATGIQ
jgi:hypothetical protein